MERLRYRARSKVVAVAIGVGLVASGCLLGYAIWKAVRG